MKRFCLLMGLILLLSSCAGRKTQVVEIPEPLEDIKSPQATERSAGSLWAKNNPSIFSDHKARNVGDIVTVLISEEASASKEAKTSTGRTTSISASIPTLFGLEKSDVIGDQTSLDWDNLVSADFDNSFEGDGSTTREEELTASLTTQVVGVYPNGNLKIRGGKEVMVNSEVQIIYLTGIIRPVDVTAANTIPSTKILNARISYTGKGAISDKQEPGWLMRTLDNIWPF